MTDSSDSRTATSLADWSRAIDAAIEAQSAVAATLMAEVVLAYFPRHLPTYLRMLQICWHMERWSEGEEWGRRLLQADPGNSLAWRALARAAELEDKRAQSNIIWRRAFEMSPYEPEIRAGLTRTSLNPPSVLAYDPACLAALYLRGRHWDEAADAYRALVAADQRRVDFQLCLAVALWQMGEEREAYTLARVLVQRHPYLLMAWMTLADIGDEADRALAANPLDTMDPDREYAAAYWGVGERRDDISILVTEEEVELLKYRLPVRGDALSS